MKRNQSSIVHRWSLSYNLTGATIRQPHSSKPWLNTMVWLIIHQCYSCLPRTQPYLAFCSFHISHSSRWCSTSPIPRRCLKPWLIFELLVAARFQDVLLCSQVINLQCSTGADIFQGIKVPSSRKLSMQGAAHVKLDNQMPHVKCQRGRQGDRHVQCQMGGNGNCA